MPPHLVYALMAKEDERFEHSGIDLQAFARAVVYGGKEGGGSTIFSSWQNCCLHKGVFKINFKEPFQNQKRNGLLQ